MPAFLWAAPASSWRTPVLLVALAVIADASEVVLASGIRFDASSVVVLALPGPLPTLLVLMLPQLVSALVLVGPWAPLPRRVLAVTC